MKIKRDDIPKPGKTLTISGDEAWLASIYEAFHRQNLKENRRITGSLLIQADAYGFVQVRGEIRFEPLLSCSRCADLVSWELARQVDVEFRPKPTEQDREVDLSPEELDYYYLDEDACVDLELLVNDTIQTAIPTQVIVRSDDGRCCTVCQSDISSPLVSGSSSDEQDSPFAILKNIKLDS